MRKLKVGYLYILVFSMSLNFTSIALPQSGTVQGVIKDELGNLLAGVKVSVFIIHKEQQERKLSKTVYSSSDGSYIVTGLGTETHELEFETQGFQSQVVTVSVNSSPPLIYVVQMIVDKPCIGFKGNNIELSDDDKSQIMKQILINEIRFNPHLVKVISLTNSKVYLSSKNISAKLHPILQDVSIQVLSPDEVIQQTRKEDEFEYGTFSIIRITGNCVGVSIVWEPSKCAISAEPCILSGQGSTYQLIKKDGSWSCRAVSGWIS